MPGEVERHVRIQNLEPNQTARPSAEHIWQTIPNGDKVAMWDYSTMMVTDEAAGTESKRFVFHVRFVEGVRKGSRLSYLGNHFTVLGVSDSKRLVGLELNCAPATP